jgi:hypothetical protein
VGCNGSEVTSVFRKPGERIAGGGVSGVSGVRAVDRDEGIVKGVRVVIWGRDIVGVVGEGRGS